MLAMHSVVIGMGQPSYFKERSDALAAFLVGFVLAWLQLVFLTWTKSLIPAFGPMWADPLLADIDCRLFGVDAWQLVDPFMRPIGALVDTLYALWSLALQFVLIAVLLAPPSRRKSRVLLTFFLAMAIIGVIGQFLLPSGGPIFWSRLGLGHRFDGLRSEHVALVAADWLWTKHVGNAVDFATGISAFPSMHVAMAAWMVLAVQALHPRFRIISWAYFLVVLLGSIYLGWHYLIDGIGGSIGVILCWCCAAAFLPATRHTNSAAATPTAPSEA